MSLFGVTPALIAHVKKQEGWVPRPYICPAGYPTIGYGHRIPTMQHPVITLEQGEKILEQDLVKYQEAALRLSPGLKDEPEQRAAAIIDFCFNLGIGAYAGSTLRLKVAAKDWKAAGQQYRKWVYARNPKTGRKEVHPVLVRRREICAKWLEAE